MKKVNNPKDVEEIIANSPEGRNTRFLNSAHSLWFRFKNYEKHPPLMLEDKEGEPCALIFATYSSRSRYMNLYEIVTIEGKEGNGYASRIWEEAIADAVSKGMKRLKLSCTPSSVTWHMRNGLVFWGVDKSGSLRSDQPLFPTRSEQVEFREKAVLNPNLVLPPSKVCGNLINDDIESHGFGPKKAANVNKAISDVGDYWLRNHLIESNSSSLEGFM